MFTFVKVEKCTLKKRVMFLENSVNRDTATGWIEVITGSMFSGKTEELIRRLKRARFAGQRIEVFKPDIDTRYASEQIVSHDTRVIESIPAAHSSTVMLLTQFPEVVGIDEAQFFDMGIIQVCSQLANRGVRVIVAGLDMDYKGEPFGPVPGLLAIAEYVTKVHAICVRCGNLAHYSHRKNNSNQLVLLGETESYEPLCRTCFNKLSEANTSLS
jgi:thymidine kinase